jgi:RNA polymerase sigma factor (sigma-70 family)
MTPNSNNYYRANENLRFKLTTPEEERNLFVAAKKGDTAAREFLIHNHLLFAARFARRQNRGRLPDDEVISAVNAALMNAIDRFDPERGNRFTRYLMPFLRGAIAGLWKSKNTVTPSSHSDKFPGFTPYTEEEHDNNRGTNPPHLPVKTQRQIAELAPSTDEIVMEREELTLNLAMLKNCRCKLTAGEKELLRLIYDEKISMADIAQQRKVSRQAVHAAHGQIVAKLRAGFKRAAK